MFVELLFSNNPRKGNGGDGMVMIHEKVKGQGLVEYALILVLVAVVVIFVLTVLGPTIGNMFSTINATLP